MHPLWVRVAGFGGGAQRWRCLPAPHGSPWTALATSLRAFFVRFQATPNEDCYKFSLDGVNFLPKGGHTVMFDRENDYQSPLAKRILRALPMVEEVTIGHDFVTVKQVEEASSSAAARYFAMCFHETTADELLGGDNTEGGQAARPQSPQQRTDDVVTKTETAKHAGAPPPPHQQPFFGPGGPDTFEMGGFAVRQSREEEEALDEAALQQLIEATSWSELRMHVSALLTDHVFSGEPHVSPDAPHPHSDTLPQEGDSEVVLMIKELIAATVRPQLQDDGGDIRFVCFVPETGSMEVELLGACRTCKSSKTTLVDLIERTTRHWIPEVSAVVEVSRRASAFERFAASRASAAAAVAPQPSSSQAADEGGVEEEKEEKEEEETDPTKIAGEGGVHKRVVVDRRASAKVVREVHQSAAAAGGDRGGTPRREDEAQGEVSAASSSLGVTARAAAVTN